MVPLSRRPARWACSASANSPTSSWLQERVELLFELDLAPGFPLVAGGDRLRPGDPVEMGSRRPGQPGGCQRGARRPTLLQLGDRRRARASRRAHVFPAKSIEFNRFEVARRPSLWRRRLPSTLAVVRKWRRGQDQERVILLRAELKSSGEKRTLASGFRIRVVASDGTVLYSHGGALHGGSKTSKPKSSPASRRRIVERKLW